MERDIANVKSDRRNPVIMRLVRTVTESSVFMQKAAPTTGFDEHYTSLYTSRLGLKAS
jgi:hypothetical protein